MQTLIFKSVALDQSDAVPEDEPTTSWLWDGYLARGNLTLLTSQWKAGKTTLLAGLLRQLAVGGRFLDRACAPAKALVVSEESRQHWNMRLRTIPIGPHAQLLACPFRTRPSIDEWNQLIDHACNLHDAGELDLFVVDPLASFMPGRTAQPDPSSWRSAAHSRRPAWLNAADSSANTSRDS